MLPSGSPGKRSRWVGCWAPACVGLLATGSCCVLWKGPTPGQVERRARADVPLGTPRQGVEDYLRSRSLEFVAVEGATTDVYGRTRVVDMVGLQGPEVGATVRAYVEPAFVSLLWSGEVRLYFFFDHHSRLIAYAFVPSANAL
jgi:hypothetical protein